MARVLMVHPDSTETLRLSQTVRGRGLEPWGWTHCSSMAAALEHLEREAADLILLDLKSSDLEDLARLNELRQRRPLPPLLVMTPLVEESVGKEALRQGAADYLIKDRLDPDLLARAIRYALENHQLKKHVQALATVDELTGLYNRRGFLLLGEQHLSLAGRMNRPVELLFIDVDRVKHINQTLGWAQGDLALTDTANILRRTFRHSDISARLGSDQFASLVLVTPDSNAEILRARLRQQVEDHRSSQIRPYRLSLSVGCTRRDAGSQSCLVEMLTEGKALMDQQKRSNIRAGERPTSRLARSGTSLEQNQGEDSPFSMKVLMVEDAPHAVRAMRRLLSERSEELCDLPPVQLEVVDDVTQALAQVRTKGIDLILLNLGSGQPERMEVLKQLQSQAAEIPMIVCAERRLQDRDRLAAQLGPRSSLVQEAIDKPTLAGLLHQALREKRVQTMLADCRIPTSHLFSEETAIVLNYDLEEKITALSRSGQRLTGYSASEIQRMKLAEVTEPSDLEVLRAVASREHDPPDPFMELTLRGKNGRRLELEVITRLLHHQGRTVGVQAIGRDATERKRLERLLRQASKMESIGKLTSGVVHDFNNLLTAILGCSELVLHRLREGDPSRQDLELIKRAGERAESLTRQLLAFTRLQEPRPKPLNINDGVTSAHRMLRRLIGEDIELISILQAEGRVRSDQAQLEQLIMNLAVNARDAMPHGGKLIIETADVDISGPNPRLPEDIEPGPYILLTVRDTGCGMDSDTQAHIFESYFTTKDHGKGTGLGLSTVRELVRQWGGKISVSSQLGQGSLFKIFFPRLDGSPEDDGLAEEMRPIPKGSETILLVEDEEVVRRVVRTILQRSGYHVLEASNGDEAIREVEAFPGAVQLLVTDVVMPHMSGRELAKRLKKAQPGMKVLYVSGYINNWFFSFGLGELGMGYLEKPFTPSTLACRVREVLDA